MKSNYHTHSTWCDGSASVAEMAQAAFQRRFDRLGFSSHMTLPWEDSCAVAPSRATAYVAAVRAVAARWQGRLEVWCGAEADYIPGVTDPDRTRYDFLGLDYLLGSIHYVVAPDGARVAVDDTPSILWEGIQTHFGGSAEALVRAYFRQERDMVARFDFDVVAHPDLCRKFNRRHPYFDETAGWYRQEVEETAAVIAASGKLVEVNTGAISRGWLEDAYPAPFFRSLLRAQGVQFILSSDAHTPTALDGGFELFATAEDYVELPRSHMG